ncbi:uncharacterized protein LOC133391799 [Anopheles gambiae]|uniref:uncharacterized protein LOC133391799 n=1 Tax=Anopheles gambiae TaxID=7165 RepID=UPI002AC90A6D|nr:uncharacterized protein LOC133391799 [Anopheles gambiae]
MPPLKKHKPYQLPSDFEPLLARLGIESAQDGAHHRAAFALFGRNITFEAMEWNQSHYYLLRSWFRDGRSGRAPTRGPLLGMNGAAARPFRTFTTMRPNLESSLPRSNMTPYPVVVPFQRMEAPLPQEILNDRNKLLAYHKVHWRQVRLDWTHHRKLHLENFAPSLEAIETYRVQPTNV